MFARICSGLYEGVTLDRHFNVKLNKDSAERNDFAVLPGSDYCRLMRRLFADIEEAGGDWLSPDNLDGLKVTIEVQSVTTDHRRESHMGKDQYSKIKHILEAVKNE